MGRVSQGDIFEDIEVIEGYRIYEDNIEIEKISFPYVVCLNQECDLSSDCGARESNKDASLLHLAIAPAFNFEQYLTGDHWGDIFKQNQAFKRENIIIKKIIDNETPRYHYLKFPDKEMPELIIDFKHFFTINRNSLYAQMDKRLCSMDDLFRESISQRFSNYISRIGLPVHIG